MSRPATACAAELSNGEAACPDPLCPANPPGPINPACRLAAALVAAAKGLAVEDILGQRRACAAVANARQLAMYLAHVAFGVPQSDVARGFRRDRTTVAYACRRIEDLRDGPFDGEVTRLEACARWAVDA